MYEKNITRRAFFACLTALTLSFSLFFFAGCATMSQRTGGNSEEALRNRVSKYYEAVIAKDWDSVYSYHDSAFQKSIEKVVFSSRTRSTLITAYEIKKITLNEASDSADVFVEAEISVRGYTFKGVPQNSKWVIQKRKWVRLAQPPGEEMKNPFDQPESETPAP